MTIGQRFRTWRGGRTQADVAKLLGVHQTTIVRLEQDLYIPSADLAETLQKVTRRAVTIAMCTEAKRTRREVRREARTGTGG